MISLVLHQIFSHCRTSTIILVFTPHIQSSYKIKRDDFTQVLLSLPYGPLKIACHKGAFDMLNILDLTSRPSCNMPVCVTSSAKNSGLNAPLENVRPCDRSMQSPSCADECLADDVFLDVFTSWCLLQSACTYFIHTVKLHDL